MICIIRPRSLVIVAMVTCVAAMVHSRDDRDVRSVTKDQPEPRTDSNGCLFVSEDPAINSKDPVIGEYEICVQMSPLHQGGTQGTVKLEIQYQSGRHGWTYVFSVGKTYVPAGSRRCYKESHEYCEGDRVWKVYISIYSEVTFDDNAPCSCDWFPSYIEIKGPQECDRYICHWGQQCCSHTAGTLEYCPPHCIFGKTDFYERSIRCAPANPGYCNN